MSRSKAFQLYTATVRLGGSMLNEVQKADLTAPEIVALHAIHGPDSVLKIAPMKAGGKNKTADRSDRDERARLRSTYEGALPTKAGFVNRLFGPVAALPREYSAEDYDVSEVSVETRAQDPAAAQTAAVLVG